MLQRINTPSLVIIAIVIGFVLFFNSMIINIRLREADYHLHKVSITEYSQNSFLISSKYALIRKQMEQGESGDNSYQFENNIQLVLSEEQGAMPQHEYVPVSKYHPISIILTLIRKFLGKEELVILHENSSLSRELMIAFYLERNRNYARAIDKYDTIMNENELTSSLYSSILLHKSFCLSMSGRLRESANLYDTIYRDAPTSEIGIVSRQMRDFILSLIEKNSMVITKNKDDLSIGREFYYNMNYKGALSYLNSAILKEKSKIIPEAQYYKGRIFEETGKYSQATEQYHKIMYLDPKDRWCKAANRRLVMLGAIYNQQHPLLKSAKTNLSKMNDTLFLQDIDKKEELLVTNKLEEELKEFVLEEPLFENDTFLMSLEKDTTFAIKEEKPKTITPRSVAKVVKKVTKSRKQPKPVKRTLTEAEKIELKRELANSKYRKPHFIRKTLRSETHKLQKIFLSYVNSGEDIKGKVVVRIKIKSSGSLEVNLVSSEISNSEFNSRIVKEISTWKFPEIDERLGAMTIAFPFNFTP